MSDPTPLRLSPTLSLPIDAVTETFGILAKKGAGKSNAAVVMAEEMWKAGVPWVAIDPKGDWWGLRSSADGQKPGLPLVVFGGRHGDIPLEPTAGPLIADLILDNRLTCVLDVSEFSKADVTRFLLAFAERLYRQAEDEPLHLFLEEAHEYLPQRVMRDEARLVGAWQKIVKQGRFKGLGCSLVSQRSASLNKDVLTQVDTLIVLRTTSPQDRAAVKAWVDVHDASDEMMHDLPTLADGEAWVWSPEFLKTLVKIQFRRRETFDSGATPRVGQVRRPPATLADVDLGSIKEAMADTIEKAGENDPKALKRRIVDLERQLAAAVKTQSPVRVETVEKIVHVERIPARLLTDLRKLSVQLQQILGADTQVAGTTTGTQSRRTPDAARERPTPSTVSRPTPAGDVQLKAGARRLLDTVARHHPMRLSQSQVGTLAGFKITGGTFQTYKSILKREGLIDIDGEGMWTSTDAGRIEAGVSTAEPLTTDQVLERWRSVLKKGARDMLDLLIAARPQSIDRGDLAAELGMAESGGTFQTYLSTLRRNGLADIDGRAVTASNSLFLGGQP